MRLHGADLVVAAASARSPKPVAARSSPPLAVTPARRRRCHGPPLAVAMAPCSPPQLWPPARRRLAARSVPPGRRGRPRARCRLAAGPARRRLAARSSSSRPLVPAPGAAAPPSPPRASERGGKRGGVAARSDWGWAGAGIGARVSPGRPFYTAAVKRNRRPRFVLKHDPTTVF
jgi:hypothetical protein